MERTYLFYDLETTGLNKSFDQIVQFAAIRTDLELNELERHEFFVKLNPDTVPSPKAAVTHRISIQSLEQGLNELEACRRIHKLLNTPGTISLGYNTLEYDDKFLNFSFYRNLLTPYTHSYANGCSRMDIFPMLVMFYLYQPQILIWPEKDGALSLKLEHLNAANQLATGAAHNALVDIEVTLALARLLKKQSERWEYLHRLFDREIIQNRINQLFKTLLHLKQHPQVLAIHSKFGAKNYFQAPALGLGWSKVYKKYSLWLQLDHPALAQATFDSISETTQCIRKKLGDGVFILPPETRFYIHLSSERIELAQKNLSHLQSQPQLLDAIVEYYQNYAYPKILNLDAHGSLYASGFLNRDEETICHSFHRGNVQQKLACLDQLKKPELRQLTLRLLGHYFQDQLKPVLLNEYQHYLTKINPKAEEDALIGYDGSKKLTPKKALIEIEELKKQETLDQQQLQLLDELQNYIQQHFDLGARQRAEIT